VGVTGIVGPNGAGKTTLFNTLAGELVPTAGTVHLGDRDITGTAAHTVARLGVRRTFQIVRLAARLTVLDNVALGSVEATAGLVPSLLLRREQRRLHTIRDEARTALARVGCAHLADRHPGELPLGERRLVEVARALMGRPALLLLDEPASGLADDQRAQLGELVRELGRTTSIVVIEHDVDFIASVAERVIVMAEGAKIFEGAAEDAFRDPVVVTAYLGADVAREAIDPEPVEVES
jgi:ABC-type branched-subunit amino acid transport system ATPase component